MKYEVSPKVRQTLDRLLALDSVKKAMAFAEQDAEQTLENQIELCKIEAPTFHEQQKAARYAEMYQELSLKDVHIDDHGNVVGVRPGVGGGKKVLMEGHMDTVDAFLGRFGGTLEVLAGSEHFFHRPEQLATLEQWLEKKL